MKSIYLLLLILFLVGCENKKTEEEKHSKVDERKGTLTEEVLDSIKEK